MQELTDMLRRNLAMKLLALFSAIFLWLYVMNEQNPPVEVNYTVPVEVRNLGVELVAHQLPDTVRIRVRGPRNTVAGLNPAEMKAVLDLRGLGEGKQAPRFQVAVPAGVELLDIQPNPAALSLEMVVSRQLPVEVRLTGVPEAQAASFKAESAVKQVQLDGLRSAVGAVAKVVVNLDVAGKEGPFAAEAPLLALNNEGKVVEGVSLTPDVTRVAVSWTRPQASKVVDVEAALINQLPLGTKITRLVIVPNKVEVQGEKALLDVLPYVSTEPIDLSKIEGSVEKELPLPPREGITFRTNTVRVQISVER